MNLHARLLLAALLATGCAHRPSAVPAAAAPATVAPAAGAPRCEAQPDLDAAPPLDTRGTPLREAFNVHSRCVWDREGRALRYAVVRLPRLRGIWTLSVESRLDGEQLFAPELATLDAQGRVQRRWGFERFALRGDRLHASLFFGAEDAGERYLLVRAAPEALGQVRQTQVSAAYFLPLPVGPVPLIAAHGTEHARRYVLDQTGVVDLAAHPRHAAWRMSAAQQTLRGELAGLAR